MGTSENNLDTTNYRLALVDSSSRTLMCKIGTDGPCLPRVGIPKWTRQAEEINDAIHKEWCLKTIVLCLLPSIETKPACAVVEVIASTKDVTSCDLILQPLDAFGESELEAEEYLEIRAIISGTTRLRGPFSRLGWLLEARNWIRENVRDHLVAFTDDFRQYNASETFTLTRLDTIDGRPYWLKATGAPLAHEYPVTVALTKLFPQYIPPLVAVRDDWNAWVTEHAGESLGNCQEVTILTAAVESLAELQISSLGQCEALIEAGCMDRRLSRIRTNLEEIFSFLDEAMRLQTSTKAKPLATERLRQIEAIVGQACDRMQNLGIPDCLVNGDINLDNILFDGSAFRFTDWSEAGVGNPFLMLQQVNQHVIRDGEHLDWLTHLCSAYRKRWREILDDQQIEAAFTLMPLLTIADYLYGRGDWLHSSRRNEPSFQSFARTLGRCMDRAAVELSTAEVLQA